MSEAPEGGVEDIRQLKERHDAVQQPTDPECRSPEGGVFRLRCGILGARRNGVNEVFYLI
jgi:hypothetical protein